MNVAVVLRATWAVARVLHDRGLGGATVVVGRDARHGSEAFATAAAEVFAAQGFRVIALPHPAPTPVVAFAVRRTGAAAGVQITASHNPARDNGYKVYADGGLQIVSPTDREIEAAIAGAPPPTDRPPDRRTVGYRAARRLRPPRRSGARGHDPVRIALTAMHGVGGELALRTLEAAGFDDVHVVASQFEPDPDFPTVAFPNPEEPGATDALLRTAERVGPASRSPWTPTPTAARSAFPLSTAGECSPGTKPVGCSVISFLPGSGGGRPPARWWPAAWCPPSCSPRSRPTTAPGTCRPHRLQVAGPRRRRHPGARLVYAYEEAIGHCVDPETVRDKDGISAAVLACDLVRVGLAPGVVRCRRRWTSWPAGTVCTPPQRSPAPPPPRRSRRDDGAAAQPPPRELAGIPVTVTDLLQRTDAVILAGGDDGASVRMVVRPSGTEPKVKCYTEVRLSPDPDLAGGAVAGHGAAVPPARRGARLVVSAARTAGHRRRRGRARCRRPRSARRRRSR